MDPRNSTRLNQIYKEPYAEVYEKVMDALKNVPLVIFLLNQFVGELVVNGDFMYVKNNVSTRDPITFFGSPIRYILARLGFNPDVEFLPALETHWGFDHSFESETYQIQMELDAINFMDKYYK